LGWMGRLFFRQEVSIGPSLSPCGVSRSQVRRRKPPERRVSLPDANGESCRNQTRPLVENCQRLPMATSRARHSHRAKDQNVIDYPNSFLTSPVVREERQQKPLDRERLLLCRNPAISVFNQQHLSCVVPPIASGLCGGA
jgi:hypothetical protein